MTNHEFLTTVKKMMWSSVEFEERFVAAVVDKLEPDDLMEIFYGIIEERYNAELGLSTKICGAGCAPEEA